MSQTSGPFDRTAYTGGIDIGGTSVRLAVLDANGEVAAYVAEPRPLGSPEEVLHALAARLATLAAGRLLTAVGVGVAGPVDPTTGVVENPFTLPGWDHVPLRAVLAQAAGVPVRVENDADAAVAGEWALGAGQGAEVLAMLTLGTGVGGAVISAAGLLRGANQRHPEIGHHVVADDGPECYCGAVGCLEALAAGPAIALAAGLLDAEAVAAAADAGDAAARDVFRQAGVYVGRAIRNLEAFYAPDVVLVGGGLGERVDLLGAGIDEGRGRETGIHTRARVAPAALGDRAGAFGAAILARDVA